MKPDSATVDYSGKKVTVLGLGKSGLSCIAFFACIPKLCIELGLPYLSSRYGSIAFLTDSLIRVVAALSQYI